MSISRFSEGDYIRTVDGLFFAVKGGIHSNKLVVSILRYIPDEKGERVYNGKRYRRVYDQDSSTKYLKKKYSSYINYIDWLGLTLQSVPISHIKEIYKPTELLKKILVNPKSELEIKVAQFVRTLSRYSNVSLSSFGVSGSLLIGLDKDDSDIDLNVYGEHEGRSVYNALKKLRDSESLVYAYDNNSIEQIMISRWEDTELELEQLREIECEKVLHGLYFDIDYFIRLIANEEASTSFPLGKVTISAIITNTSEAIFIPCIYEVEDTFIERESAVFIIKELKSYRGKFTEQVKVGDKVKARGTLERVNRKNEIFYHLILGNKGDYLIPIRC